MFPPGGGSDVASLKTTAVRKGDDLIINGQKVSSGSTTLKGYNNIFWLLQRLFHNFNPILYF